MESADTLREEKKLLSEAKYRNYMSNIDKALRNFEYSSEWADLISALGKLSKAISSNTHYQIIPRRIKISKRLAQCMHPALPSGVHLKALETYDVIFSKTGPERLATELFIYSAGLFPLFGYAAMNVRPTLLSLYEKYFVPLGERLRPALSGFLSGVLPGYEIGLDHFERTNSLLSQVCTAVSPAYFYTCLWECVATNASIRLPAISFLLEHFNKRLGMQEQHYVMGYNHDIMMCGICACLNDAVILVQRNTLEFLLLGFPMHTPLLSKGDLVKLVTNGLNTILRRDMSLNRRLYSWLLGSELAKTLMDVVEENGNRETYFERYSHTILIEAVICTLKFSLDSGPVDLKPYRILVSLLDKAEIGPVILDYVLCDVIRTMALSNGNVEVTKSANSLFDTFDPAYIWNFMTIMYEKSCKIANEPSSKLSKNLRSMSQHSEDKFQPVVGGGDPTLIEICFLTEFLLETISLEMYNETTRIYLPRVFLVTTKLLTIHSENLTHEEVIASLKLCMKIVSRVQPMISSPIKILPSSIKNGSIITATTTTTSGISSAATNDDPSLSSSNSKAMQINAVSEGGVSSLEKSKSDSRLNQSSLDEPIRRSNSNQFIEKKSPKKQKKAKSYTKLLELDKEICPDTGQFILPADLESNSKKNRNKKSNSPYLKLRSSPKRENRTKTKAQSSAETPNQDRADYKRLSKDSTTSDISKTDSIQSNRSIGSKDDCSLEEFTILEKCIRQYETFFQVFISRQVLKISTSSSRLCLITVNEIPDSANIDRQNTANILANDDVFDDGCKERLVEIDKFFTTLKIHTVGRTEHLHNLLSKSLISNSASDLSDSDFKDCQSSSGTEQSDFPEGGRLKRFDDGIERQIALLSGLKLSEGLRNAIKLASNLLVEMSTFPNCDQSLILDHKELELPSWLKVLTLISCYTKNDKELQLAAVATLFDLISLLKSQMEHTTSPGVTFVVMLPLLKFGHVSFLENQTRVFQLIVSNLWNYLGDRSTDPLQISSLLHQLHNCLESGLVEAVIGNRMSNSHTEFQDAEVLGNFVKLGSNMRRLQNYKLDRIADIRIMCLLPSQVDCSELNESEAKSFKKFELLWHLGRDKQSSKGFDKTLLRVLDILSLPHNTSMRTFVTKWLQESFLRGDFGRLIKPLMRIFLSPSTKRISIVHAHALKKDARDGSVSESTLSRDVDDETDSLLDRDVFAISSEDGNIKYHMDVTNKQKRSPIRSLQKKFFGVTLGNKNKTSNFLSNKSAANMQPAGPSSLPLTNTVQTDNISTTDSNNVVGLIINPLGLSSADDIEQITNDLNNDEHDTLLLHDSDSNNSRNQHQHHNNVKNLNGANFIMGGSTNEKEYANEAENNLFSSGDDDSSHESDTETESERREQINGKDIIVSTSSELKRFAGDCENVAETLSEHDRTKNRKTYRLTRAGSEAIEKFEMSFTGVTEGIASTSAPASSSSARSTTIAGNDFEESHAADEYFSSSSDADVVEVFMQDLVNQVAESTENPIDKTTSLKKSHKFRKHNEKRTSCTSKTSSDSANSSTNIIHDQFAAANTENFEINNSNSEDESSVFTQEKITGKDEIDSKKKSLTLTTNINWEQSKQNVEILRQNVANRNRFLKRKPMEDRKSHQLHQFHTHILLYYGAYDTKQTLYAFQTLRNLICSDTRTFLCLSISTSLPNCSSKQQLIRHRKSAVGKGFIGSILNTEFSQNYRGCMYLEALVTICLYYARSFFDQEIAEQNKEPNREDILGNCKVQLASIELLTLICSELIEIVKGMGKRLACYIADLMAKCKLQKIILHCLNSSVLSFAPEKDSTVTEKILAFNYPVDENLHSESLQIQLLRLLMAIIKLEYEATLLMNADDQKSDGSTTATNSNSPTKLSSATSINVKYLPNCLISQQAMFLAAVLSALQANHLRHLHRNWTELVTSSLSCFNFGSLTNIVISVVHQLCNNIDKIAESGAKEQYEFPPDYIISQLEAITILCHYCLLDNTQQTTLSHLFNQAYPQTNTSVSSSNTGQLLTSLMPSFLSSQGSNETSQQPRNAQHMAARNAVLSHLSRIVASVAAVWDNEQGQQRQIKQQIMEFLTPISLHHGANFLGAVAVTWQERGEQHRRQQETKMERKGSNGENSLKSYLPQAIPKQLSLVKLVSSIRVMPMDSFVQTLHQVVKSPPPIHHPPVGLTIETSALELFYFYMKAAPAPQLGDSWCSLLALLRDGIGLSPPAQFVMLSILNEFVQRCPHMPFQDKRDLRDLHDVTSRLVDALSSVAGACLEQTTWLRRNLAVKEDISPATPDGSIKDLTGNQQYCVQAQSVLAAILANLLDVAYGSQEKDKVVTIITTLMCNITPYLKNHTSRNIPSFYACSNLLASLSGYQYTRKAWRKDMLDLLLDSAFFQMDISCLGFWKQIMDSLMTYDNTTFRELMSRVSLTQTGALNIFTSREQEYEQRAILLKRLAFVIFCSEHDQYHKYMPEIQEQLTNSLRLPSVVPAVQAAVFLCIRVVLLRMSPDHVTSLWPIIIAEMVQVFLAIEQELNSDSAETSSRLLSGIDAPWVSAGIASQNHLINWRNVQLETAKLLELGCVLPATKLPHFQMYRWAFVGTQVDTPQVEILTNGYTDDLQLFSVDAYVSHVRKIAVLMDLKYAVHSPKQEHKKGTHLVLTCQQITNLQDLYGFFSTLRVMCPSPHNFADTDKEVDCCINELEHVLANDFLEKMTSNATPR